MKGLPLAAAWTRGTRDPVRDEMLETAVVAVSDRHPLASRKRVAVTDLAEQPLSSPSAGRARTATI